MSLPIGTPVTVTLAAMYEYDMGRDNDLYEPPVKYSGIITATIPEAGLGDCIVDADDDDEVYAFWSEVKIRYDKPVPFTLWTTPMYGLVDAATINKIRSVN
jgi:hypothetical protein